MTFALVFVFIFGTIVGSFLNVVILRYNTGESIIKNGSRCFSCGRRLKWYELIPLISFLIQRGKCRKCKSKISIQYPIVEILTGIIFLLIFSAQAGQFSLFYYWIVFSLLTIIAVYDLRHQIIPNLLVYLFDILVFLKIIWDWGFGNWDFLERIAVGLAFFSFFGLLWLVSRGNWMGLGDAKLALGIGWLLGLTKGIVALIFSFWIGALVSIFLLFFFKSRYNIKSRVAFGPFLVLGTTIAFFLGDAIIKLII